MACYHLKTLVASLMCVASLAQPLEGLLDWEEFQDALVEDGSDEGLSLLQANVNVKIARLTSDSQDSLHDAGNDGDSLGVMDDISPDDFATTISEEKVPEAVSLMQTEAHIQRTSTHGSLRAAMVANADGSVVIETQNSMPLDGIVHMSVGGDGSFTWEGVAEELSLVQKGATLKVGSAKQEDSQQESQSDSWTSSEAIEDDSFEGISLLQADAHIQTVVTKADGSIAMESKTPQAEDGMMSMSIDADGSSEAISLIQRHTSLKTGSPKESQIEKGSTKENDHQEENNSMSDVAVDNFVQALQTSAKAPEGVAFIQTDAHVKKASMVTESDGSISLESAIARPHDGIVHMSVGASGSFQWEI